MTTLAALTLQLAKIVVPVQEATASANGTTQTLIDLVNVRGDNYFRGGEIWFLSGTNAGKIALVTAYQRATGKFTFSPALANPTVVGDLYAANAGRYKHVALVKAINTALLSLGPVRTENTALTVVDGQEEYSLPAGVRNVCKVEILQNTTSPYVPYEHLRWDEIPGVTPKLRFDANWLPSAGCTIRLTYNAAPTELFAYNDTVSDYIPIERIAWSAAVAFLRSLFQDLRVMPAVTVNLYNEAKAQETAMLARPLPLADKSPRFSGW